MRAPRARLFRRSPAGVGLALGLALAAAGIASAATSSSVGPGPPPHGLAQSRCGHLALRPHVVRVGQRITGLAGPGHCGAWTWATRPSFWSGTGPPPLSAYQLYVYDLAGNGADGYVQPIRRCGHSDSTCLIKAVRETASARVTGTSRHPHVTTVYHYFQACIHGTSSQGPWQSCDYFAVLAGKPKRHHRKPRHHR